MGTNVLMMCAFCRGGLAKNVDGLLVCDSCSKTFCENCLEKLDDQKRHKCDEETLKTFKAIFGSCRACPQCKQFVEKADGCSQMFCVAKREDGSVCGTLFDFETGKLSDGAAHNPHYVQFIKENNLKILGSELQRFFIPLETLKQIFQHIYLFSVSFVTDF
jgi:hypothetical protein